MSRSIRLPFCLAIMIAVGSAEHARADVESAAFALRALLAAGSIRITPQSTCSGQIPQVQRLTLGAIVASRLAHLDGGDNRVLGECSERKTCKVSIKRSDGEDVQSAEFTFSVTNGKLSPNSLRCVFTP